MFHDESRKFISILGSKGEKSRLQVTKTVPAWVFTLLWVLASSSSSLRLHGLLMHVPCRPSAKVGAVTAEGDERRSCASATWAWRGRLALRCWRSFSLSCWCRVLDEPVRSGFAVISRTSTQVHTFSRILSRTFKPRFSVRLKRADPLLGIRTCPCIMVYTVQANYQ